MKVEVGGVFGYLTIVALNNSMHRGDSWNCKCVCGKEKTLNTSDLVGNRNNTRNPVKSCGCKKQKQNGATMVYSDLYFKWSDIKTRCYKDTQESKIYYRDKGITVCDDWRNDFQKFLEWSLANGYKKGLSLDRIDSEGNYEPENCRWTTKMVQAQNRGMHKNNTSGAKGVRKTPNGRYYAYITREFKRYNLGAYDTFEDAKDAREKAEQYYEEFRTLESYRPEWKRLREVK